MYGFEEYEYLVTEYSIEDVREDLGRVRDFFKAQPYHEHAMDLFMVKWRKFPMSVCEEADCFCVDEELELDQIPEWMKAESLGVVRHNRLRMEGRCVFPIKDVKGNIMGFTGWDPTIDPKYVDSRNYGYKANKTTIYGMEKLPEYYVSKGPVFLTEGLMCTLYLRWKRFMALASLGSHLTPYVIQIMRRFGDRLVLIADNDEAGNKFVRQVKRECPKAIIVQVKYGKDVDGCRTYEDGKYEEQLLRELSSITNPFVKTSLLIRR